MAEEDDVEAFFDGIFEDGSQQSPRSGSKPKTPNSDAKKTPTSDAKKSEGSSRKQVEEDLFGDFNSESRSETGSVRDSEQRHKRKKEKKDKKDKAESSSPPDKKSRVTDISADPSKFFELEAEEAGQGSGDEDEAEIEGLIDDSEAPSGTSKFKLQAALQKVANSEVEDLRKEMDSRGDETGARRVFGGSFLDRLQEKYQDEEEGEMDTRPQLSVQERFRQAQRNVQQGFAEHRPLAQTFVPRAAASVPELEKVQQQAMLPEDQQEVYDRRNKPRKAELLAQKDTNTHIVPAAGDPKLWRCRTYADEKALCTALILKSTEFFKQGKEPPIFSVFYSSHQRGYIYVEAFREAVIREFIRGIRGISPWSIVVVPVVQMPQVFTSCLTDASFKTSVKVGEWVRARRKPYNGDLARIEEIRDMEYTIKLKPRIQYKLELSEKAGDREARDSRKRSSARWFNKTDLEAAGIMVSVALQASSRGNLHYYQVEEDLFRDGFLYKTVRISALETGEQVRPQEHEVQDWQFAPGISDDVRPPEDISRQEDDRKLMPPPSAIPTKMKLPVAPLIDGEMVIVNKGELRNLRGRVRKIVSGSKTCTVTPLDVGMSQNIELAIDTLSKYFEVGDYVKTLSGKHVGEAGYLMKLNYGGLPAWHEDSIASVLSANLTVEFETRLDELQLTSQKSEQVMTQGDFTVGGIVQLQSNSGSRGIVVRLETTACGGKAEVLLPTGRKQYIGVAELTPLNMERRLTDKLWTLDRKDNVISVGCVVKAPRGQMKAAPIRALIVFIHNETCFLRAEQGLTGDRAYLVCTGKKVELVYNSKDQKKLEMGDRFKEQLEKAPEETQSIQAALEAAGSSGNMMKLATETEWMQDWFKKMMGIEESEGKGVSEAGAPVRILGGAYKGLRAEVRANLGDKVRLSLLCKPKLVIVPMQFIAPDDFSNNPKRMRRRQGRDEVPATPVPPMVQDKQPGTPLNDFDFADPDDDLSATNCWDPTFLMADAQAAAIKDQPGASGFDVRGTAAEASGAGNPEPLSATVLPAPGSVSHSSNSKRRKRKGLLPDEPSESPADVARPAKAARTSPGGGLEGDGGATPRPGESPSTLHAGLSSPVASPMVDRAARKQVKADKESKRDGTWALPGVGVHVQSAEGPRPAWVLEVLNMGNRLRVVPGSAAVGDEDLMFDIPASAAAPWLCDGRGDVVGIAGKCKGTKGRVIGTEGDVAYMRPDGQSRKKTTLAFAVTTGKDLLTVSRQDMAKYSQAWVKAHGENLRKPKLDEEPASDGGDPDRPLVFEGESEVKAPPTRDSGDSEDDWAAEAARQAAAGTPTPTAGGLEQRKIEQRFDDSCVGEEIGVCTPHTGAEDEPTPKAEPMGEDNPAGDAPPYAWDGQDVTVMPAKKELAEEIPF